MAVVHQRRYLVFFQTSLESTLESLANLLFALRQERRRIQHEKQQLNVEWAKVVMVNVLLLHIIDGSSEGCVRDPI